MSTPSVELPRAAEKVAKKSPADRWPEERRVIAADDSRGLRGRRERGRRVLRLLYASGMIPPLVVLWVALLFGLILGEAALYGDGGSRMLYSMLGCIAVASASLTFLMIAWVRRLAAPLTRLEHSLGQVCDGEPGATLDIDTSAALTGIAEKIDSLREELVELYEDMDARVARQTARLAQKTASLKILYDVAATINQTSSLDELLLRFLRVLKEMIRGRTATVRLISPEGDCRLVGSIGLDNEVLRDEQLLPVRLCPCGKALTLGDIICEHECRFCRNLDAGRDMYGTDQIDRIRVPLKYLGRTLGVYDVFVAKPGIAGREDIRELLSTVGHHLGMAVAKQRSDAEARRLVILEERTNLAHELHDSLAQTLASLRFQVRLLADTLSHESSVNSACREVDRIRSGLDQAHTELRELLNSFRGPVDRRGLMPALDRVVQRFREETGIAAFLQKDCRQIDLSAGEELQLIRIVQEALANVRKHANAHFVRVLLRCRGRDQASMRLLVEDDGEGFDDEGAGSGEPGEHLGLSIMHQRAARLGAELRVESEPGEGTRVELNYRPADRMRQFSGREDLT